MCFRIHRYLSPALIINFILLISDEAGAQQTNEAQIADQVVVRAERYEYSGQREILAGKIILGRDWIEKTAATSVADALRRESTVSIGAGGRVSLKGLLGYTRILVDGEVAAGGVNPLDMDPALVERIEIIHSAEAESGAFGLAGTINVVTRSRRKPLPKQTNLTVIGNGLDKSEKGSLQGGWRDIQGATFNFSGEISRSRVTVPGTASWDWEVADRSLGKSAELIEQHNSDEALSIMPSFSWKPSVNDELQFRGSILVVRSGAENISGFLNGVPFESDGVRPQKSRTSEIQNAQSASLNGHWRHRFDDDATLTAQLKMQQERQNQERSAYTVWSQNLLNQLAISHQSASRRARSQLIYAFPNRDGHRIQFAMSGELLSQSTDQRSIINGAEAQGDWLGAYHADLAAIDSALWGQDDWNFSDSLEIKFGWRTEYRTRQWVSGGFNSKNFATISSPSINISQQFDSQGERTLTAGLARSFAPIGAGMLGTRPDIAGTSICSIKERCGTNDPNMPDRVGNPSIKYESAWGLDVGFDTKCKENTQWSIRAYHRWINDTLVWVTQRESVAWADVPRWVNRPINSGSATAFGVSVGGDTNLEDWIKNAPDISVNTSLQWNSSHLRNLQTHDNRIEGQQPWSGRLGVTYRARQIPLELQADLLLNPAQWWQASIDRRVFTSTERDFSAKAIWVFSPQRKLIVSLQNLSPSPMRKIVQFSGDPSMQLSSSQYPRMNISLRLEMQLN